MSGTMPIEAGELTLLLQRITALFLAFFTLLPNYFFSFPMTAEQENLLDICDSTFENGTEISDTSWAAFPDGELKITPDGEGGGNCLSMSRRTREWDSPS